MVKVRSARTDSVQVERNLSLARMDQVIERFAQEARGAATVVFYFSGHGLTGAPERRSYLLPVDARTGVPGAAPLRRQAVAAHDVRDLLEKAGARVTLMLLDACRDGPGDGRSGSKGLARVGGGNGLLVAYATEEGHIAADGDGAHSPYAQALAEAWRQPRLPILAQLDQVYDTVTARVPGQRPTREGNLRVDAFLANPFAPVTPANRDAVEDAAWALCQNGATKLPCEDYLSGWPQGRYVALARSRMRDLEAAAAARREGPTSPPTPEPGPGPGIVASSRQPGDVFRDCADCPEMVVVPAGIFLMGSPPGEAARDDDERPQRRVTIPRPFAIGKYEVTQGQWRAVMGDNPSRFKDCGDDCPVEMVSWDDVQEFIQRLNLKTGQRYRLPSEAEWEYAARAGTKTPFHTGQKIAVEHANFNATHGRPMGPVRVGSFPANAWGLHDMHGNVWEWVVDCYGLYSHPLSPSDGGANEEANCPLRVLRGGGWISHPTFLRAGQRNKNAPDGRFDVTGFRVVRTLF